MMFRRFTRGLLSGFPAVFAGGVILLIVPHAARAQLSGVKDGALMRAGTIEGRLVVPPGSAEAIDGVTVTLLGTETKVKVDASGRYEMPAVPPGTYTLVATGDAFSILLITDVVLRPGQHLLLDVEEMPLPLREGEVHRMEPVIVSARKQLDELARVEIVEERPKPLASGNVDLPRTQNDAQPYYLFDRRAIERSGAATVEEFVTRRVPMDATKFRLSNVAVASGAGFGAADNKSSINLNGFGAEHTAILVNGRRLPNVSTRGAQNSDRQADLNGIPLAAIKRIEFLPASSSAIYGSDAIGGAVNIVMRDDYQGAELEVGFENPYGGSAPIWRAAFTAGGVFEGGRTSAMVSISATDIQPVRYGDRRELLENYRERAWRNDPERTGAPSYAAVPLGLTTNVVAAPTTRVVDGRPVVGPGALFGPGSSDRTFVPEGYAGGAGRVAFERNAGMLNLDPAPDASGRPSYPGLSSPLELETNIATGFATLRRRFFSSLEFFAEISRSRNRAVNLNEPGGITADLPANAPGNVFGVPVRVTARLPLNLEPSRQDISDERFVVGANLDLPQGWKAQADAAVATNRIRTSGGQFEPAPLLQAVQAGTVDLLRDLRMHPIPLEPYTSTGHGDDGTSARSVELRAGGPAGRLPAGDVSATFGVGGWKDEMRDSVTTRMRHAPGLPVVSESRIGGAEQLNLHAYGEVWVPLVSRSNARTAVAQLDVQLAGRIDRFTVYDINPAGADETYDASNLTAGIRYRPVPDVLLRGSYSTGFRAPDFAEIKPMSPPLAGSPFSPTGWLPIPVRDPKRGGEISTQSTVSLGGNSAVRPERSDNLTFGLVLEPRLLPGLRVSLDSTLIHRRDEIRVFPWQTIVDQEEIFPGRVVRGSVTPGDPFGVGRITFVDATMMNVPESRSLNYNLTVDYRWDTQRHGSWHFYLLGNSWQHYQRRLGHGRPFEEQINSGTGVSQEQPKFVGNAGVDWTKGRWGAGWAIRYLGHHRANEAFRRANGDEFVPQQSYHDVYVAYTFRDGVPRPVGGVLSGISLQLGAKNVFNTPPRFDGANARYFSPYGSLRLGSYYFSLKKRF